MIRQANKLDSYNIAKLIIAGWQTAYKELLFPHFSIIQFLLQFLTYLYIFNSHNLSLQLSINTFI